MSPRTPKTPVFSSPHALQAVRKAAGVSLRDLGAEAKIDFRRLSLIERGLSDDEINHLCKAFKRLAKATVTPADLR
jgi:transcriptional regulator with XRE-family HTH domain